MTNLSDLYDVYVGQALKDEANASKFLGNVIHSGAYDVLLGAPKRSVYPANFPGEGCDRVSIPMTFYQDGEKVGMLFVDMTWLEIRDSYDNLLRDAKLFGMLADISESEIVGEILGTCEGRWIKVFGRETFRVLVEHLDPEAQAKALDKGASMSAKRTVYLGTKSDPQQLDESARYQALGYSSKFTIFTLSKVKQSEFADDGIPF